MIRVVSSELLKLRTTRTFSRWRGSAIGLVMLAVVLVLALGRPVRRERRALAAVVREVRAGLHDADPRRRLQRGRVPARTIAWTLLVTPVRLRVAAGQALACALGGAAISTVTAALTAVVALPWLGAKDAASLSSGEVIGIFAGGILYGALAAAFGAGLGALLRNQVVAVVLVLVFLFVVGPHADRPHRRVRQVLPDGLQTTSPAAPRRISAATTCCRSGSRR